MIRYYQTRLHFSNGMSAPATVDTETGDDVPEGKSRVIAHYRFWEIYEKPEYVKSLFKVDTKLIYIDYPQEITKEEILAFQNKNSQNSRRWEFEDDVKNPKDLGAPE